MQITKDEQAARAWTQEIGRLGLPGCEGLSDELGGHRPREIEQALRDIGDAENPADGIVRTFAGRGLVKPAFRHLHGRGQLGPLRARAGLRPARCGAVRRA